MSEIRRSLSGPGVQVVGRYGVGSEQDEETDCLPLVAGWGFGSSSGYVGERWVKQQARDPRTVSGAVGCRPTELARACSSCAKR